MKITWEWHAIDCHNVMGAAVTNLVSKEEHEEEDAKMIVHFLCGILSDFGGVIVVKNLEVVE
jgi:hypothetical protein